MPILVNQCTTVTVHSAKFTIWRDTDPRKRASSPDRPREPTTRWLAYREAAIRPLDAGIWKAFVLTLTPSGIRALAFRSARISSARRCPPYTRATAFS